MEKLTLVALQEFQNEYHARPTRIPFYGKLRFGQAVCANFKLPKNIEDQIYYTESELEVISVLYNFLIPSKGE